MTIEEAFELIGIEHLLDPAQRQIMWREVQADAQRRADQGDPSVDMDKLKRAKEVFDRVFDGDIHGMTPADLEGVREVLKLPPAGGWTPDPQASRPSAPQFQPMVPARRSGGGGGGEGAAIVLGLGAFGLAMFALGRASNS